MRNASVREFRAKLAEILEGSEPVLVTRHGRNVALVYPLNDPRSVPLEVRRRIAETLQHRTARSLHVSASTGRITSPVIESYKRDVDRSRIRVQLKRSPEERAARAEELFAALADHRVEFVIVGGLATTMHGSARLPSGIDVVYGRSPRNIRNLVSALAPLSPYVRGAPRGLPFRWDEETVTAGLNFTLVTSGGPIDLMGEIAGGFDYDVLRSRSTVLDIFKRKVRLIDLDALIESSRAAGRPKDFEVIAELEVIRDDF